MLSQPILAVIRGLASFFSFFVQGLFQKNKKIYRDQAIVAYQLARQAKLL